MLSLTVDHIQLCDWDQSTFYHLTEHIASPYGRKLVRIPDQKDLRPGFDTGKELVTQMHVHHGYFIHVDKSCI